MTTIQDIRNEVNTKKLKADEVLTLNDMIEIQTGVNLSSRFENECKFKVFKDEKRNWITTFFISNEEILNTLRQLYVLTKNKFVKSVVKTVGINKKMTDKQMNIIIEELVKFNQITINF